jgi:hypothetical protein
MRTATEEYMFKQRNHRAPLIAIVGLLGVFAVPAAAQAHHISLVASCDASSTVNWQVDFIDFSGSAKPTVAGTVKLDGTAVQTVPTDATIDFSDNPGTLSGSKPAAGGQTHVVRADFTWTEGDTPRSATEEVTTLACPTPPATPPTTPPTTTTPPAGAVLPETIASGTARLRGPSGCVKQAFRARVTGRSIAAVAFYVDGKLVKNITGKRSVYRMTVKPGRYGFGRHKVVARVKFVAGSGTRARRLPLTFRRCARAVVAPRFTG